MLHGNNPFRYQRPRLRFRNSRKYWVNPYRYRFLSADIEGAKHDKGTRRAAVDAAHLGQPLYICLRGQAAGSSTEELLNINHCICLGHGVARLFSSRLFSGRGADLNH